MTIQITPDNYYSLEANQAYFTASQIKTFLGCPSRWLAERNGVYKREETDALFHGKYIDTALTEPDKFDQFCIDNADKVMTGKKKRKPIQDIDKAIRRVQKDDFFMFYMTGEAQVIIVLEDFHGFPYKCMLDILNREHGFLTDLKSCRDVNGEEWTKLDDGKNAKIHWINFWRYPLQLAIYREAVRIKYHFRPDPIIAAMEKKAVPNFDVFDLLETGPLQGELERGLDAMAAMTEIKDADPLDEGTVKRCHRCEWCLMNKRLVKAKKHVYDPRMLRF